MDIEEIITAKRHMRAELTAAIEDAILRFNSKTGLYPKSISVNLVDTSTYGGGPSHHLASIDIEVDIP